MTDAAIEPAKPGRFRWMICALLFATITINYVDRQVMSVLKPLIETDLGWNEVDYGNIVSAFQFAYAIGMIFVGRWLDRIGTRHGVAIAIALWSIAAAFHAGARNAFQFIIARSVLGIAESGGYPGAVKASAEWFPRRERALAMGFLNAGANVGVVVTPIVALPLAYAFGWQAAFLVTGGLGFMLLIVWIALYRKPADHPRLSAAELIHIESDAEAETGPALGWRDALTQRQAWAFIAGKFFTDPIWSLFLFWLPDFLAKTQGMELFPKGSTGILATIGPALIVVYLLADVGSIGGGWLSSRLIHRGWSVNRARKTAMFCCALLAVPVAFVVAVPAPWMAVLIVGGATAAHQGFSANLYTIISDMYPRRAVATIVGLGGAAGAVGSIVMAQVTGWTLQLTGSYVPLVAYAGCGYLIALGIIHWLAPRLDPAPLTVADRRA